MLQAQRQAGLQHDHHGRARFAASLTRQWLTTTEGLAITQLSEALPAHVVNTSDVQVYDHIGALCRIMANGSMTGGAYSIVEERARAGYMAPRHVHEREAETFIVLSGELEGWVAGTVSQVTGGNLVYLPAKPRARFPDRFADPPLPDADHARGFESFFGDSGIALQEDFDGVLPIPGPLSPEDGAALQAILTPLGCTITGPPPFAPERTTGGASLPPGHPSTPAGADSVNQRSSSHARS